MVEYKLNVKAEIEYARLWAYKRNPKYYNFEELGGDCTNFVSQCIYAGGAKMNYTKETGWYYLNLNNRAAAWTGVEYFYNFMVKNRSVGPFGIEVELREAKAGDVIQLGDFSGDYYHTLFVVNSYGGEVYVASHSFDSFNRPLYTYDYNRLRCIHIIGSRADI